jgi:hypothetical protein
MTNLIKSHRAIGIERARTEEYVIVETSSEPGHILALSLITTQPGDLSDVKLQLRFELADAISKAKFLGLDLDAILSVIADEIVVASKPE